MELRYFPSSFSAKRPYLDFDNLFEYVLFSDSSTEELTVDFGWRADREVKFWLPTLRSEMMMQLEEQRISLPRRLCCCRVDIIALKRPQREDLPFDLHREAARLTRQLLFQAEHVTFLPASLLTETVTSIAQEMIDAQEHQAMPILADALQEAGCDWELLLKHCRNCTDHGQRCWVLRLIERSRVIAQGDS